MYGGVTEDEHDRGMERDYLGGGENYRYWTMHVEWTFGGRIERRIGALGEPVLKLHFFCLGPAQVRGTDRQDLFPYPHTLRCGQEHYPHRYLCVL